MASRFILRAAAFAALCGFTVALVPGTARADIAAALGEAPQGFGRATTGGCTEQSCKCTVTTLKDEPANVSGSLRSCLETEGAKWVVFAARGTISLARPLKVASHKLIDGRRQKPDDGPVTLAGSAKFLLHIEGAENIAVSDLYFRPDAASPNNPNATPACRNPQRPTDTYMCGHPIALQMPRQERRARWQPMMDSLMQRSIHTWFADFMAQLKAPQHNVVVLPPTKVPALASLTGELALGAQAQL